MTNATARPLASFTYHGHHTVTLARTPEGHQVTCNTCSLPASVVAAVQFMQGHNVHSLVLDGASLTRI